MSVKVVTKAAVAQTKVSLVKAGVSGVNVTLAPHGGLLYLGGSDLSCDQNGVVSNGLNVPQNMMYTIQLAASEELFCVTALGSADVIALTTFGSIV